MKVFILSVLIVSVIADTYFYSCFEVPFCVRYEDFQSIQLDRPIKYNNYPENRVTEFNGTQHYKVVPASIKNSAQSLNFNLELVFNQSEKTPTQTEKLNGQIRFYKGGIMRVLINEAEGLEKRYRVSQEPNFAIMDEQLTPIHMNSFIEDNLVHLTPYSRDIEGTYFQIQIDPFRIRSYVNGEVVLTLNEGDTLYFEKSTGLHNKTCLDGDLWTEFYQQNQIVEAERIKAEEAVNRAKKEQLTPEQEEIQNILEQKYREEMVEYNRKKSEIQNKYACEQMTLKQKKLCKQNSIAEIRKIPKPINPTPTQAPAKDTATLWKELPRQRQDKEDFHNPFNGYDRYERRIDYEMAVGMGALFETKFLYGLPERYSSLLLEESQNQEPYRLYPNDIFIKTPNDKRGTYASIPYITGHSSKFDSSLLWVNSAESWVDLIGQEKNKMFSNFISESGQIELFIFSSDCPKKQINTLAQITGFAPMPPIESLGFHFSKYTEITADIVIERDQNFEDNGFPVDYFWIDVDYAPNWAYFQFNEDKFPKDKLEIMNEQIQQHSRRIVVITDPHIKADDNFFVYKDGVEIEQKSQASQIFVHDCKDNLFYGKCWPDKSVWIDFLNEEAQKYWEGLYSYEKFKGVTQIYSAWNDMNEPSVFDTEQGTIPKQSKHMKKDGSFIKHRDVHNMYGAIMQRSTYKGMMARDENKRRVFLLVRSFFIGSQKYGAFWTGDNAATQQEVLDSVNTLLSIGIAGNFFGGADVPGFFGTPSQELYIQFYQLGVFYPFYRAHCWIVGTEREPWLQSDNVQQVIRESVFLRYSLIHLAYTLFKYGSLTGIPIMRPMMLEFPQDEELFYIGNQFMYGDSILVSPKISQKDFYSNSWNVETSLPQSTQWYEWNSRKLEKRNSPIRSEYSDFEMAVWIKAGSIIPLLDHKRELSLLRALINPIRLEIYTDQFGSGFGKLVLDDGWSTKPDFSMFEFTFSQGLLSYSSSKMSSFVTDKEISEVTIFGVKSKPESLKVLDQKENSFAINYDAESQKFNVQGLNIKLILTLGASRNLIQFVY